MKSLNFVVFDYIPLQPFPDTTLATLAVENHVSRAVSAKKLEVNSVGKKEGNRVDLFMVVQFLHNDGHYAEMGLCKVGLYAKTGFMPRCALCQDGLCAKRW